MKFVLTLCLLLTLSSSKIHQESYRALYQFHFKSNIMEMIPISVNGTYEVRVNERYLEVIGQIDNNVSGMKGFNLHTANERIIYDLKNNLVYLPDQDSFMRAKRYQLESTSSSPHKSSCDSALVKGYSPLIILCDSIPELVTPGILFNNMEGRGIKKVTSANYQINLESFEVSKKKFDYDDIFKKCKNTKNLATFHFFTE